MGRPVARSPSNTWFLTLIIKMKQTIILVVLVCCFIISIKAIPQDTASCPSGDCKSCLDSCSSCDQCGLCSLCFGSKIGPCAQCKFCKGGAAGCKKLCNKGKNTSTCKTCILNCS